MGWQIEPRACMVEDPAVRRGDHAFFADECTIDVIAHSGLDAEGGICAVLLDQRAQTAAIAHGPIEQKARVSDAELLVRRLRTNIARASASCSTVCAI